ncbi:MAG: dicarboxylate/amino acid:cation symporter [Candidatus Dadabacteria bacterium]|nr:MAG: dicarboxylate/amino acid:cation symporter [Candidatus Dadabacteria bacterium]
MTRPKGAAPKNTVPKNKVLSIVIGILCGLLLGGLWPEWGREVKFIGDLFLRALLMLVVPLVMASIVSGITSLGDIRKLGKIGYVTLGFYLVTTALAVVTGIVLVVFIKPGLHSEALAIGGAPSIPARKGIADMLREMVMGLVPDNIFRAMSEADVLPLIVFSIVFGVVLSTVGSKGKALREFFVGLDETIMGIVNLLMKVAPLGVGAIVAGKLGEAGGFSGFIPEVSRLGFYVATVLLGLLFHSVVSLPLILYLISGRNPLNYLYNMAEALLTAFSTASSSATLPVTMECAIEKNGVPEKISSFVFPLGATVNMDGTALYEAVAAVFIAQLYGVDLGIGELAIISITATLAAIGAAGIPEAGLVTMVLVLKAVNLPVEGIGAILIVDWFLDRCRTAVNVWGDGVGAAVVAECA